MGVEIMKEQIYDEQVAPLMERIIAICKEHKIAMIADFSLDDDLSCTSALLADEYSPKEKQLKALDLLRPKRAFSIAETIETRPDGSKRISMRLV